MYGHDMYKTCAVDRISWYDMLFRHEKLGCPFTFKFVKDHVSPDKINEYRPKEVPNYVANVFQILNVYSLAY